MLGLLPLHANPVAGGAARACDRVSRHWLLGSLVAGVWLPSAALYGDRESAWVLLPAVVITAVLTAAARSHGSHEVEAIVGGPAGALVISSSAAAAWTAGMLRAFAASDILQTGLVIAASEPIVAVPALSAATALIVGGIERGRAGSCMSVRDLSWQAGLLAAAAVVLTAVALLPHLGRTRIGGDGGSEPQPAPEPARATPASVPQFATVHPGVILAGDTSEDHGGSANAVDRADGGPGADGESAEHPVLWRVLDLPSAGYAAAAGVRGHPRQSGGANSAFDRPRAAENGGASEPRDVSEHCLLQSDRRDRDERRAVSWDREGGATAREHGNERETAGVARDRTAAAATRRTRRAAADDGDANVPSTSERAIRRGLLVFHVDPMRAHEAARVAVERFVLVPR